MSKARQLEFGFFKKMKIESSRLKPQTLNPTRRKKDFRKAVELMRSRVEAGHSTDAELDLRKVKLAGAAGLKHGEFIFKMPGKFNPRHYEQTRSHFDFLKTIKFEHLRIVPIKDVIIRGGENSPVAIQRFFRVPTLRMLELHFYPPDPVMDVINYGGVRPGLSASDKHLCEEFLAKNPKVTGPLVWGALNELFTKCTAKGSPIDGYNIYGLRDGEKVVLDRTYDGSNYLVFGVDRKGKAEELKIGVADV